MKGERGRRLGFVLVVGLMLAAIAPAAHAACGDCTSPDFRIRLIGGALKGSNVYNTTAVGQTANALAKPDTTRQFVLSIQNDGVHATSYNVSIAGFNGNFEHFTPEYVVGWVAPQDITFTLQSTGYTTPVLSPGQVFYFRVYVHVHSTSSPGIYTGATLNVTDSVDSDRVAWKVTTN